MKKFQAVLSRPRCRGKTFDKVLVSRFLGLQITRFDESHLVRPRVDVRVWVGRSRASSRYHATVSVTLEDGSICSGSGSAQESEGWAPGQAILSACQEAGIDLKRTQHPADASQSVEGLHALLHRSDVHGAIQAIGEDILGQALCVVE